MPPRSRVVVQITDCHLLAVPGARLYGWDNQAALAAVVAHVRAACPIIDAVLLTGDLAHDESAAGYRYLAREIDRLKVPLLGAIPGNHDDIKTLHGAMPDVDTHGPMTLGGWRLQLLHSQVPGSDAGRVGTRALAALAADLAAHRHTPTLIAVHHPPAAVGAAWLDTMALADGPALLALAGRHPQVRSVLCGHVHQALDAVYNRVRVLATPAVTRQFRPGSDQFAEDLQRLPGYRTLRLGAEGSLTTRVRRVPAAAQARCAQKCG